MPLIPALDKTELYIRMLTLQSVRMSALKTCNEVGGNTTPTGRAFLLLSDHIGEEIAELKDKVAEIERGEK